MRRLALIAALILLALTGPALAAVSGVSANYSKGVVLLGSPAGAATCNAGNTGAIRYNSTTPRIEFCNGTSWLANGGMTLISTQTASASASLQFTNLPTTYNTLFMNCSGLILSANEVVKVLVGEGAGPTWENGAHYTVSEFVTGVSWSGFNASTTISDITDNTSNEVSTFPYSIKLYIDNVGSSSIYKNIIFNTGAYFQGNSQSSVGGSSYWNNDTNPITGLEVVLGAGTITSGTCSLYGLN